jgi:hypothetical protein
VDDNDKSSERQFQSLINGTGSGFNLLKTQSSLLRNLLKKNIIFPCEFGGIQLDYNTLQPIIIPSHNTDIESNNDNNTKGSRQINIESNTKGNIKSNNVLKGLYFCGDSTNFGTCFTTADISQIKVMIKRIVYSIMDIESKNI